MNTRNPALKLLPLLASVTWLGTVGAAPARANAIASLYNGDQYSLPGLFLLQDAADTSRFYWAPHRYVLSTSSQLVTDDDGNQSVVNKYELSHRVVTKSDAKQYSMYTFKVELDRPGRIDLARAQNLIRRATGHNVDVSQMAPTCGISMGLPAVSGQAAGGGGGVEVTYGFSESSAGSCAQSGIPDQFTVMVQVPMGLEPGVAESFVRGVGIPLPSVKIFHPYKYADHVQVHIDTMRLFEQLKDVKSISGSLPIVQASINQTMAKALTNLQAVGKVTLDIQNPDPKVHERMFEIVTDMLKNIFFKFVAFDSNIGHGADPAMPEACKANAEQALIKSASGQAIPMCVSASLSHNESSAREIGDFDFDLSQSNYSTIYSDTTIELPEIPAWLIDSKVRELDPAGFGP